MSQTTSSKRLQQTQAQVDEVVGIMRTNVEKVLERDQKLSELDDRADALQQGASQFEQQAGKLKRKYWWKNLKMIAIAVAIIIILIFVLGRLISRGEKLIFFTGILCESTMSFESQPMKFD
ncbi:Vesicle-associated membrane protein 2 [Sarcoptes scabiei]|nr:Vesicle-associated membrane protein 2 [Sarcoptes scabiei]